MSGVDTKKSQHQEATFKEKKHEESQKEEKKYTRKIWIRMRKIIEIHTVLFFRKQYRKLRKTRIMKKRNLFLKKCRKNPKRMENRQNKHETNRFFG